MSIFRSYHLKSNTLISSNLTNNSQNPVTEIFYGGEDKNVSRFIFDIDLSELMTKISSGLINPSGITKHVLHLTNTINYAQEYIGKKSYSSSIERASGFNLELYNIAEDWDEGTGYDFMYTTTLIPNAVEESSNWVYRKNNIPWTNEGSYYSGNSINTIWFNKGCESIDLDITNYVNQRLFGTGYTGNTVYTGNSYGLGVKFTNNYESLQTVLTQAVAFHTKNTNTWYEPYVETTIDDTITDDRKFFYLDKDNDLYLLFNVGGYASDIIVNKVDIYDYQDNLIATLIGNSITKISRGVYKITLNLSSLVYPDAVLFRDVWDLTLNGRSLTHSDDFYLISSDRYYRFNDSNSINLNNYHFNFSGIYEREYVTAGVVKKIKLNVKEFYPNQNNNIPLNIEYRVFTTVGDKYEIDVIPFTPVNRIGSGYEFALDTSWLLPQDYYIQIRLNNGNYYEDKGKLSFTIVSNKLI